LGLLPTVGVVTAKIDRNLQAAPPVVAASPPATGQTPRPPADEAARRKRHEERALRWKLIAEAGGIDAWIAAEIAAKGLSEGGDDPSEMNDRDKARFKERKKAEAVERRSLQKLAWEAYQATHITHLGPGVHWNDEPPAEDAFDVDQREARARTLGLELPGVNELAQSLGVTIPELRSMAYHREVDTISNYRQWQIPKRDGTPRTISSPKKRLKTSQRWVLRNVCDRLPVHAAAHGFLSSRSIVSNARAHAGAEVVVKVDIKDFFPSITWKRVKGLLRKSGAAENVATLLSLLTTECPRDTVQFRGKTLYVARGPRALPQGAPTSPAITNAICMRLDRRVAGLSRALGFRYTRYADDLTFSWRRPEKSEPGARCSVGSLLHSLKVILEAEGFQLNPKKTRIMRGGNRQTVTGLIVNEAKGKPEARVPRETLRTLRAALHNREQGKPGKDGESLAHLQGMAAFVFMTDPVRGRALLDRVAALQAREKTGALPL
jgi:retron-type reverse transcriptase